MVEITEKEFHMLTNFIKANYGINLKREKMTLVTGRLHNVLEEAGCNTYTEYYQYLIHDKSGNAIKDLLNKITTNHTFFMREADHFTYLREYVLPLLKNTIKDNDIRIWCAACSTGEEAYTLAMLLDEFMGLDKYLWDTKILATDISQKALETATNGIFSNESLAPLPHHWRLNYFHKVDHEKSEVIHPIKNQVLFRKFNLMEEIYPFKKKLHVIFCRNVMIYFSNETKEKLIEKFYHHLEHGGYLFVGHSEPLNRDTARFQYVMPSVYRKI